MIAEAGGANPENSRCRELTGAATMESAPDWGDKGVEVLMGAGSGHTYEANAAGSMKGLQVTADGAEGAGSCRHRDASPASS
jgi:hypothetical protein